MKTIKIFAYVLFSAFAVSLASCTGTSSSKPATEQVAIPLSVDQILALDGVEPGQTVVLEGVCTHICSHGAKKIFLMGSDDTKTIRIESTPEIGKFSQKSVNSLVRVEGILKEERIDENYLLAWEERLRQQTEEKHGKAGESGCSTEKKARGEGNSATVEERIANYRARIEKRNEQEGKNYLSFYHVVATSYEIQ